jgi:hypothetical protein
MMPQVPHPLIVQTMGLRTTPLHRFAVEGMEHQKETAIQAAILDYLALKRVFAIRINNIPATFFDKTGARQFRRLPKHTPRGVADIFAIKDGEPIFLEVKSESGKQSPEQEQFEIDAIRAGAIYSVVRSIDDVAALGL